MSDAKGLEYRGDIRAIAATGKMVAWVTEHPEKIPTAVYRLDAESLDLETANLPCGGLAILADKKGFWVSGDNALLYQLTPKAKKPKQIAELPGPATCLAQLSDKRLAALCESTLVVVDSAKGELLQQIGLADAGTALAADPTGEWLAVGLNDGSVSVFECEDKDTFQPSETEKLHNGAVTSMLFEPEELRFFTAGADQKLLLTHARGRLEPEDRGRSNQHGDRVTAMVLAPGERFITGSRDKSCKTWARVGAAKPATQNEGVSAVVDMAMCEVHGRTQIAIACSDNSIRFFVIDAAGRFGNATQRVNDAYSRAKDMLAHSDPAQRGEALSSLADYADNRSVKMLAQHVGNESDHKLRVRTTQLLCKSDSPLAGKLLEPFLQVDDMVVRQTAFDGLCSRAADGDFSPMELALDSGHDNIATDAIKRLTKLAKGDEIANRMIVDALQHQLHEVRTSAQLNLETIGKSDSPEANLLGLASGQPDARTLGLVRLFQREMMDLPRVKAALRRALDDGDANVRMHAYLVATLPHKELSAALRFRDQDLHRKYHALETIGKDKAKDAPKAKKASADVPVEQLDALLTAMASRASDTSLRGAKGLASLGDPRSLGTLLQLSCVDDEKMRGEVCGALAELGDSRATDRLKTMLNDSAASVRDAAYTSFDVLTAKDPLEAAESGLSSSHEDVRRRALESLVKFVRKSAKNKKNAQALELLVRALNDSDDSVRNECFKAVLNLGIGGGDDDTLRFALASVHSDIRREVLTEVIANEKKEWAQTLLFELFSDPASDIRSEAFEHAIEKTKKREIAPMQSGLGSKYSNIRLAAINYLIELATPESQECLVSAVGDKNKEVRQKALGAIIDQDVASALTDSLTNEHDDVRLRVACVLAATHGDQASRDVLLGFVTAAEPQNDDDRAVWRQTVNRALGGLADLGDSSVAEQVRPLLSHDDPTVRAKATGVFAGFFDQSAAETLSSMMRDSDPGVQIAAANGLAVCGDSSAMPLVFETLSLEVNTLAPIVAAVVYDEAAELRLISLLDSNDDWVSNVALMTLLARDLYAHDGTPRRCIACLSAQPPRVRLIASRAVEAFGDQALSEQVLLRLVNSRGAEDDWNVSNETVQEVAATLVYASSPVRQRLILSLQSLDKTEQNAWDQQWSSFRNRFESEIQAAMKSATSGSKKIDANSEQQTQIAFGTYVGLVREQRNYYYQSTFSSFGTTITAIRETAIRRLVQIVADDATRQASARPVLLQALGDPSQAVRNLAFEQLPSLGVEDETRAFAAIESGYVDLAVKGMHLLTGDAKIATIRRVLTDVITSRTDQLADEAAKLLADKTDRVEAAEVSLESPRQLLREQAVRWLAQDYNESAKAKKLLHASLDSKYLTVRFRAAVCLADKKDGKAFDALVKLLAKDDVLGYYERNELELALANLGDPRAADVALDRIENDPEQTARVEELFRLVGQFRNPENVDRLLSMMENKDWRSNAAAAILVISGFDQFIDDPYDEHVDKSWLETQHERRDQVLAQLIQRHVDLDSSSNNFVEHVESSARWSQSSEVDDVLSRLISHPDDRLRQATVYSIGWRVKYRGASTAGLIDSLQHKDVVTKFLAAEGLARSGHSDGIAILMSAVELMSEHSYRSRAVRALGELANPQAIDLLLKIAADDLHALQNVAAIAIGYLKESDRADEIFEILERLVKTECTSTQNALIGLRHFGSAEAWELLRQHARQKNWSGMNALVQLSYKDDPAHRDMFLETLAGEEFTHDVVDAARRLFGPESLEPDYAIICSDTGYSSAFGLDDLSCQRLCERGEPARILEVLPKCSEEILPILAANLLQRDPLPTAEAAAALESPFPETVATAAQIIGRHGQESSGKSIKEALDRMIGRWDKAYDQWLLRGVYGEDVDPISDALVILCWAASRTGSAKSDLITIALSHPAEAEFRMVRAAAIEALAEVKLTKTDYGKLKPLVSDDDVSIRRSAAGLFVASDPSVDLVSEAALKDREVFRAVVGVAGETQDLIESGLKGPHQQAIVLRRAVASEQTELLSATANDDDLTDNTRLGAIEGLGRIASDDSLKQLKKIGENESADEELRKAAWRSYRRSKRRLQKATS